MFLVLPTCGHRILYFLLNSYGSSNGGDSNSNINKNNKNNFHGLLYYTICTLRP